MSCIQLRAAPTMRAAAPPTSASTPARASLRLAIPRAPAATTTSRRRFLGCRATGGEGQDPQQQQGAAQQAPGEGQQPAAAGSSPGAEPPVDPTVAKGQRTAIVTGAISIIFGIIYLGLVSFLDLRGGEMLPPPPEAFGP